MFMEPRNRRNWKSNQSASTGRRSRKSMTPKLMRLKTLAQEAPDMCFNNVIHIVDEELLKLAFHRLDARKAVGTDGISKHQYDRNLDVNIADLKERIRRNAYKPVMAKQVLIPKANGKSRPIAISCLEDKIVQMALAMVLESIFEPLFEDASMGFRPKRGAHAAMQRIYHLLRRNQRPYVVDCDIKSFFDSMNHARLVEFLERRISDKNFIRLIKRLLRMGVLTVTGDEIINQTGTPQGSVVSPILANVYLHYVIDTWFRESFRSYKQQMVRYADDVVFCFKDEQAASGFMTLLRERLKENHLELNEDKTKIVEFRKDKSNSFNFLGFTFYWGQNRERNKLLKAKTSAEKLRQSILDFKIWIKTNRNRYSLKDLWSKAGEKLRGHYAYFATTVNDKTGFFYHVCTQLLFKWLNRRSQKKSLCWESFQRKLRHNPLPKPWSIHSLRLDQYLLDFAVGDL
jgi:RNA-directed DNA polymerase